MNAPFANPAGARGDGTVRTRPPMALDLAAVWYRFGPTIVGWLLPFVLILYLALKGGGYDDVVHDEVGILVWWVVLIGALVGILPRIRVGRAGWIAFGLLIAFLAWTAIGVVWSGSAESSVAQGALVATYAGVFALALSVQGRAGLQRTLNGVAAGIGVVTALALLSRLHPSWFPANTAADFIPAVRGRLNYPLNYWNGLAALAAMGIPLALTVATRARTAVAQAIAAGAVPAMALTAYYTLSRGGAIEIAVALIALLVLYPRRLSLLPTLTTTAAGSAILIAAATQRDALEHGLRSATAQSQGKDMLAVVLVVCVGVALLQIAIALAARHGLVRIPSIPRPVALGALGVAVIAAVAIALAAGAAGRLSDDWQQFKNPTVNASGSDRFASASGNGRYQLWAAAVHANGTDPLIGIGPGMYQYWWSQHGTLPNFVRNAHSLYLETLGELGIIGFALIVAFVAWVLIVGATRAFTSPADRALLAGATAATVAFAAAAGIDWVWQIPVIPVAFLLLAAAILGARPRGVSRVRSPLAPRVILAVLALASIVGIALPLAGTEALRTSQADARAGDLDAALSQARTAERIQPYSASASLQEALLLEQKGDLQGAAAAATTATEKGSVDWRNWVVLSRIQAERGNAPQAVTAYRKAKSLNPRSPLFSQ